MAQEKQVAVTVLVPGANFVNAINSLGYAIGYANDLLNTTREALEASADTDRIDTGSQYVRVTVEYFDTADEAFAQSVG